MIEPDPENKPASTPDIETQELSLDQLQKVSGGVHHHHGASTGRVGGETENRVEKTSTVVLRGWDLVQNKKE